VVVWEFWSRIDSPFGPLDIVSNESHITAVHFWGREMPPPREMPHLDAPSVLVEAAAQLQAYFGGHLTRFDLPLAPGGTEFQRAAWQALCEIPYGETITYGEQARRIGRPTATRAIGAANGRNPIPVIVPCHRVIGADGSLTGFALGTEMKRGLLEHEQRVRMAARGAA